MTEKKQTTPWKERHTAEKITLIVGWCVIACLMVYWFIPSKPEPTDPLRPLVSEAAPPTALHAIASAEALASATHYLSQLDSAMAEGKHLLKASQLPELAAHSRAFKACLKPATSSLVDLCFNRWARAARQPSLPTAGGRTK